MFASFRLSLVLTMALVAVAACAQTADTAPVRLLSVQPTALFPKGEPLRQLGWLTVENTSSAPLAVEVAVKVNGALAGSPGKLELPPGVSQQDVHVPEITADAEVTVELRRDGRPLAAMAKRWSPQRKWKVFIVKSSHEDIGYEDFLWMKQKEIADFMEMARRQATAGAAIGDGPLRTPNTYRYWLETLLFLRYYAEERSETALRELVENAVKPGLLPIAGAPSGVHTHWMDYEELVRMMYPGRRGLRDRFGLEVDTVAIVDNPSFSWSSVQALAGAGYKYAVRFGQSWRTGGNNDYKTTGLPAIFWWEGPDGRSRVLYTWRRHYGLSFWFGQAERVSADFTTFGAANVQKELAAIESGERLGPYPWDLLLVPSYQDHETPVWDARTLRRWRELYRYPEIVVSDPRDFMVEMEQRYGAQLPVLRGDLNNFSADYATIDPHSQGEKRRAARLLPLAEGLAAVASLGAPGFVLPAPAVDLAYQRLHDYDEHSWPTKPPARDVHQFNSQWGKLLEGGRALEDAERLFNRSLAALTAQIPTGAKPEWVVVNPLAHARTDLVWSDEQPDGLVDPADGQPIRTQTLSDGRTVWLARNVPAFGFKKLSSGGAKNPPATTPGPKATATTLENEFYLITFDSNSGAVTSIRDRELDRELLDPAAPYQFNQLVWVSKETGESLAGKDYAPRTGATLKPVQGPVAAEMISTLTDATLGGATITQTIRLYAGVKRIDVVNDLRHLGVLSSPRSSDRYRENIFYAFPFQVPDFTARAEYSGGVVRPFDDQLRWGSHDYLNANRWVDVSNASWGVTLALHNAPIVHFGEIRYNRFSIDYRPAKSHLYGFPWSNRMDGLATLGPADMNARVEYSFTSHAGDWNSGAASTLGWSVASPLVAKKLPAGQQGSLPSAASFLSVDAPNVQVTVLKESTQPGDGWIVRLVETAGQATMAEIDVSRFPVEAAALCDLVENDVRPLALRGGKVSVELAGFGFATVRISGKAGIPGISRVEARHVADDRATLTWPAITGAVSYNVYRSTDPDEPATAHSFVGRSTTNSFMDVGLALDTNYYFRVAAVGVGNTQGEVSPVLSVRTTSHNLAPPSPVSELGVIRQSANRLMVCWRKVPEPDVARYLVYRSEDPETDWKNLEPLAVVQPGGFHLEHHIDRDLRPGTTYHYRVLAEDWAGNRQPVSPTATGTTPQAAH